ncbi:MAG: hypothetical protein FWH27_17230 [Planctomycetaceae bacterium]|nr:hypothetical protein [Planctomycetaceae bacterium]
MAENIAKKKKKRSRVKKLLYSCSDAASACGVSSRTWRSWHVLGFIPLPIQIGKSLFWRTDELVQWTEAGCPPREDWTYSPFKMANKKLSPFSRQ